MSYYLKYKIFYFNLRIILAFICGLVTLGTLYDFLKLYRNSQNATKNNQTENENINERVINNDELEQLVDKKLETGK